MGEFQDLYAGMSDEALCSRAASGDRAAEEKIVVRYTRLVRIFSRPYFLAGADSEDLIQEGMLGLLKAVREYDNTRDASFSTYAAICIRNRLYSAIRSAARDKHAPLNRYIPFELSFLQEASGHCVGGVSSVASDPETLIIQQEAHKELLDALKGRLSNFEADVLRLYLQGLSYSEIAERVSCPPKSADNAIQRIRRKLARYLYPGETSKG